MKISRKHGKHFRASRYGAGAKRLCGGQRHTTIVGAPAVIFVDPREPYLSRQAMIVANDQLYTIVNQPYDPQAYPEALDDVDLVWNTVVESAAFFERWR